MANALSIYGALPQGVLSQGTKPQTTNTSTPTGVSSAPVNIPQTAYKAPTPGVLNSASLASPGLTSLGTNPGVINQQKPTTAIKSISTPDGTTTTYHAPGTDANGKNLPGTGGATGAGMSDASTSGMINQPYIPPTPQLNANSTTSPPYTPNPGLQGQLITGLANMSQQPGQAYTQQQEEANRINQQIEDAKKQFAKQTNDINTSGTWTSRALGEQGQANIQNSAVLSALGSQYQGATTQLGAANTQQGLQQGALTSAVGANAPQFPSYASQVYSPSTGFQQGGNTLNDAVSTIAQRVQNGQMSYADAVASLSGYGQGGVNALQQALGPNFNVAQSNTLAAQQGSIGPALQYANTAMGNLESAVSSLGSAQNTNVPIINQLTQGISTATGLGGSQQVQAYKAAIAEARSAIQKVLASVSGGTPTDYVGQSNALLPDNATPNQIAAAKQTLQALGTAKASIYQNPGNASASPASSSGSSLYSW